MITAVSVSCYLFVGLFTARAVFHRGRAKALDKLLRETDYRGTPRYTLEEARRRYEDFERFECSLVAFLYGLFWPGAGTLFWIGRWFEETAPESAEETKARIRELERANARLERELGISGTK